ncbi:MAG: formate/nitrite transporter family protein [Eubacteriales bacterium]
MYNLVKSILAGIAISFGGVAYLSNENHVIGATLFSLGLFMIYLFDWNLFTGKACYIVTSPPSHMKLVGIAFIGNLIGTAGMAYLLRLTKLKSLIRVAVGVAEYKLQNTSFSGFVLGIGCGIMMYVAVIGYKTINDGVGKYLILIMPIVVFTISGYEHVVANMFYFSMANVWSVDVFIYLIIVGLGNMLGCSFIPLTEKYLKSLPNQGSH